MFELRPAHDPTKAYGFVNCVVSLKDLSSSIWVWYRDGAKWAVKKVIDIPAEPADADQLPPAIKGFKACPPLVTDIDLSVDDKYLYVSCWGTGDLQQYDVSDPFKPKLTGKVRIGGIVARAAHPAARASRSTAGRRWSRSAGTASGSTSRTRSTARSIPSSIRTASRAGWSSSTPSPAAASRWTGSSSSSGPTATGRTRCGSQGGDASSDSYCYP